MNKKKQQRIRQIKVNYLKSTVRLISFHNGLFDFFFLSPECRLLGKRRDSLVDRIFNGIYLGKRRANREQQGWTDLKHKHVVFTSASLRTKRSRARLHQRQSRVLSRLKVMSQIKLKQSHICKKILRISTIMFEAARINHWLWLKKTAKVWGVDLKCDPK